MPAQFAFTARMEKPIFQRWTTDVPAEASVFAVASPGLAPSPPANCAWAGGATSRSMVNIKQAVFKITAPWCSRGNVDQAGIIADSKKSSVVLFFHSNPQVDQGAQKNLPRKDASGSRVLPRQATSCQISRLRTNCRCPRGQVSPSSSRRRKLPRGNRFELSWFHRSHTNCKHHHGNTIAAEKLRCSQRMLLPSLRSLESSFSSSNYLRSVHGKLSWNRSLPWGQATLHPLL